MNINDFLSEIRGDYFGIIHLNKLYSCWKAVNYPNNGLTWEEWHKIRPKVIIQLGKEEWKQIQSWGYTGSNLKGYDWNEQYKILLDLINAKVEIVDKESYIWIREKL